MEPSLELLDLDKETPQDTWTTVVSVCPFAIPKELKPGLALVLSMPACKDWRNEVAVLHIKQSQYGRYIGREEVIAMPVGPVEIGRSFINDWISANVCYVKNQPDQEDAYPGLFLVNGQVTAEQVKKQFPQRLKEIRQIQTNWFISLVKLGDDMWKKTGQHYSITDKMRVAASELNLPREWNIDPSSLEALQKKQDNETKCPMCFTVVNPQAPICFNCKFPLNAQKAAELSKKFVPGPNDTIANFNLTTGT